MNKEKTAAIEQIILEIVEKRKPQDVNELSNLVQEELSLPKQEILEHILSLQRNGKITLNVPSLATPPRLVDYIRSSQTYWYWTSLLLTVVAAILVFTVPENAYPIIYVRYVFGSILVLFLPGYGLMKALFPTKVPIQTSREELDNIERVALSIGMSIALVPIVGLLLNYTPWGIRFTPITISLLGLTLTLTTVAIVREHQAKLKEYM